jgi:hypothetical protein
MTFPAWTDYTDRDFDALRARLQDLIRSVFPTWTDFEVHNFGNILLDSFSFVGDVVDLYRENSGREGRWAFVQHRKNAIALAKLIGYRLPGAQAATGDVTIRIDNGPLPGKVVLLGAGSANPTVVRTLDISNAVSGELQERLEIAAGQISGIGFWQHSLSKIWVRSATGLPDFKMYLPVGPYLDGSAQISTTGEGAGWSAVDDFTDSGPSDLHFMVVVDHYDRGEVRFGDGVLGKIPTGNVTARYKAGGGTAGNLPANTLKKVEGTFYDEFGNLAILSAQNVSVTEGGLPREEVAAARVNAPRSLRVVTRTVAREDYEINALRVPAVGRALMLTSDQDAGIPENSGRLYVVPKTGGVPSQQTKNEVLEMVTIEYPKTVTFQVEVLDPAYLAINIRARIWISEGYDPTTVKATIAANAAAFFQPMNADGTANPQVDFGYNYKDEDGNPAGEIAWSDVFNVVRDSSGVRKVGAGLGEFTLNGAESDVVIANHQFPTLGTIELINGATGTVI